MKVLWISNVLFPEACDELKIAAPVIAGWMNSSALALLDKDSKISLSVAALYAGKEFRCLENYRIRYYLIPNKGGDQKYNPRLEPYYQTIKNEFKPDLVHIFGSECPHSLAWVRACSNSNVVVSIQGLVSSYTKYYMGGIPIKEIKKSITLRDIIRRDSLINQQNKMHERGEYEIELLKSVKHVIGRTSWDQSNTWAINPKAKYYYCNETLRAAFYRYEWKYENCEKNSIFLSQAHYPIKGLQQLVIALPIILKQYPNTMIHVAGVNFMNTSFYRKNGFANYMTKLMKTNCVTERFRFLGELKEEEMVTQYLRANVFVCPSSIENSPNSLGEAQLLGTPSIASYVGGSMDMIADGENGFLYRFEETNLLAKRICEIFNDQQLAETISKKGRITAAVRHNKNSIAEALIQIYKSILNENTFDR